MVPVAQWGPSYDNSTRRSYIEVQKRQWYKRTYHQLDGLGAVARETAVYGRIACLTAYW